MKKNDTILKRYYELLKKEKLVGKLKKSEYLELSNYEIALFDKTRWDNRKLYLDLIHNFLNGLMDSNDFTGSFSYLRDSQLSPKYENINEESFESTETMVRFCRLIDNLYLTCDTFDDEATTYEERNEAWFKDTVLDKWNEFVQVTNFNIII
jgi:hypothetical protein